MTCLNRRHERLGEEADAGVKVPCDAALPLCDDLLQQTGDEAAVDLKEGIGADPVFEAGHCVLSEIGPMRLRPACGVSSDRARRCAAL